MTGCLFNLLEDYTEQHEVAASNPAVVAQMLHRMEELTATIWSTTHANDPECHAFDMQHYHGFYGPWKELEAWETIREQFVAL